MAILIAGVVFWSAAHLLPALLPTVRNKLANKLGEGPYKGLFALDILLALGLIIYGWKTATTTLLYAPPLYGSPIVGFMMLLALVLFVASSAPTNLKRFIRHPQMMAVVLWGAAHLLSNGDSRSVILFGGLSVWALLEMVFISRRDGVWKKPSAKPATADLIVIVIAVIAFAALLNFHSYLFGVDAIAGF
ncbi:MAG: NnrU family protein [Gammaproteobacteria bacterium]|nr:NnrU family protein [Gammaproteobacteria bacterium]